MKLIKHQYTLSELDYAYKAAEDYVLENIKTKMASEIGEGLLKDGLIKADVLKEHPSGCTSIEMSLYVVSEETVEQQSETQRLLLRAKSFIDYLIESKQLRNEGLDNPETMAEGISRSIDYAVRNNRKV